MTEKFAGIVCVQGEVVNGATPKYGVGGGRGFGGADGGYAFASKDSSIDAASEAASEEELGEVWDCRGADGWSPPSHADWVDQRGYGDFEPAHFFPSGPSAFGAGGGAEERNPKQRGCHSKAGRELWVSDGTERGTRRVDDLMAGRGGSDPSYLTVGASLLSYFLTVRG